MGSGVRANKSSLRCAVFEPTRWSQRSVTD